MLQQYSQKPRQILKQTSKIKSICDYLQKKSFQFTTSTHSISSIITQLKQKLDQILYSAVQIQKITNSLIKDDGIFGGQLRGIQEYYGKEEVRGGIKGKNKNVGVRIEAEELELRLDGGSGSDTCNQALERIHRYTRKLERFEKKMGILIHQANFNRIRSKSRIQTEQYEQNSNLKTDKRPEKVQQKHSTTKKPEKAPNMPKKSKKQLLDHYSQTKKNEKIDNNNNDGNGQQFQQYKIGSRQQSQIRMIDKEIVEIAELIKRIQNEKSMQQEGYGDADGDVGDEDEEEEEEEEGDGDQ